MRDVLIYLGSLAFGAVIGWIAKSGHVERQQFAADAKRDDERDILRHLDQRRLTAPEIAHRIGVSRELVEECLTALERRRKVTSVVEYGRRVYELATEEVGDA
jgi:predicted DNA-binding protein (UPF0251 family)